MKIKNLLLAILAILAWPVFPAVSVNCAVTGCDVCDRYQCKVNSTNTGLECSPTRNISMSKTESYSNSLFSRKCYCYIGEVQVAYNTSFLSGIDSLTACRNYCSSYYSSTQAFLQNENNYSLIANQYKVVMIKKTEVFQEGCGGPYTYPVQAGTSCNDGDYKFSSKDIEGCADKELLEAQADKGQHQFGRYENQCE